MPIGEWHRDPPAKLFRSINLDSVNEHPIFVGMSRTLAAAREDLDVVTAVRQHAAGLLHIGRDASIGGIWWVFVTDECDLHDRTTDTESAMRTTPWSLRYDHMALFTIAGHTWNEFAFLASR